MLRGFGILPLPPSHTVKTFYIVFIMKQYLKIKIHDRVLGKFGGGNRKMMIEPQALDYKEQDETGPSLTVTFTDQKQPLALPVKDIIETAFNALKSSTTEPGFYRKQCWEIIRCFLLSSIQPDNDKHQTMKLLSHHTFREGKIQSG